MAGSVAVVGLAVVMLMFSGILDHGRPEAQSSPDVDKHKIITEAMEDARQTITELQTVDAVPMQAFVAELKGVERELIKLEEASSTAEADTRVDKTDWIREVESLKQYLLEIENRQPNIPQSPGAER